MPKYKRVLNTGAQVSGWQGAAGGGGGSKGAPGIVSRIFDVLSRPNYGMAEAMRRQIASGGSVGEWGKGFAAGITGKKKTTFSNVLGEMGMPGGWQRSALGFAADVGLDPTTYLTFGTGAAAKTAIKGGAKGLGMTLGKQSTREGLDVGLEAALRQTSRPLTPAQTAQLAAPPPAAIAAAPSLARTVSSKLATPILKGTDEAALKVDDLVEEGTERAVQAVPGRGPLELRVFGKPIARSQAAGNIVSAATRPIRESAAGKLLGQSFVPGFGMPAGTHALERMFAGRARARVDEFAGNAREMMKGVSKEEDKLLRRAINDDTVDALDERLRPVAEWMQTENRAMATIDHDIDKLESKLKILEGKVQRARKPSTKAEYERKAAKTSEKIGEMGKFKDMYPYRGADKPFERASENLLVQYEEYARKSAYADFLDEVSKRFGPEISEELKQHRKQINEVFGVRGENSARWQHYMNTTQGHWKRYVTAYRPGFHVRNMLGDMFNNFLAGVDPRRYKDAGRVLRHSGDNTVTVSIGKKGETYTAAEIDHFYKQAGLETAYLRADEIVRPTKGPGAFVTKAGDVREKYTRLANFIDAMDAARRRGLSLDDAIEEAGARVRKYNFDYTDLTPFERKLKMFMPFYTYTRKELPLLLQHTFSSPGKILAVPKGTRAIEGILGVEHDPDDPFPGLSEALPDWLREATPPIQFGNDRIMSPGFPTDLMQWASPKQAVKEATDQITPFLTAPVELATGKTFPEGYPQNQPLHRYLPGQFAPYGSLARDTPAPISERLWNLIHGMGYRQLNRGQ